MDSSVDIISGVVAGSIFDFGGVTPPSGYLICNGDTVSKTTYPRLFAMIGYTYGGSGDNFKLPDFRGRASVGVGVGSGLTNRNLGSIGGAETHVLTENEMAQHNHTQNPHSHGIQSIDTYYSGGPNYGLLRGRNLAAPTVWSNSEPTTATNQYTGGNAAHNNMQPSLVSTKIIKF